MITKWRFYYSLHHVFYFTFRKWIFFDLKIDILSKRY
nr:MAG TPA: hypothetical protein [Caudoviricetes sp.]